jgi:purine-binding chemotaxis protein CheW
MNQSDQLKGQYLVFLGGGTTFGAPVAQVLRIVRRLPMTRVPRAPDFVEGVINDHSQVVPVVDLRKRMALSTGGLDREREKILVVELANQVVGLLVDDVLDIVRIPEDQIQPAPAMVAQVNGVYLTGVTRVDEKVMMLLDLDQILSLDEVGDIAGLQEAS